MLGAYYSKKLRHHIQIAPARSGVFPIRKWEKTWDWTQSISRKRLIYFEYLR